uniref:Uncharacterized protein n=1 Tax=Mastacembelus armatus TaxID=205130 RepID=A0A7N8X9R0_9TELE
IAEMKSCLSLMYTFHYGCMCVSVYISISINLCLCISIYLFIYIYVCLRLCLNTGDTIHLHKFCLLKSVENVSPFLPIFKIGCDSFVSYWSLVSSYKYSQYGATM